MREDLNWGLLSKYRREIMGLACLLVMLHHAFFDYPDFLTPIRGVDIFMLMSGVGLYFSYIKKPKLGTFYARRIVRVIIPYVFLAVPFWIWKDICLKKGNFLLDVTMITFPTKGVITTWFIGAILVFYLVYPLIYKLLFETERIGRIQLEKNTLAIIIPACLAIGCLVIKRLFPEFYDDTEIALTRTVIFVIGCKMGQWVYEKKTMRSDVLWFCAIFLIFMWIQRETCPMSEYWNRMSYAPMAISVSVLVAALFNRFSLNIVRKFLGYFADRSLEIYLVHVLLKSVYLTYLPRDIFDEKGILSYLLIIAVSLIITEPIHRISNILSKKILNRKRVQVQA